MRDPVGKFKSAQEFWDNPPLQTDEALQGRRNKPKRKTEHADYMDFAERYADYVVDYEKSHDYQNKKADSK